MRRVRGRRARSLSEHQKVWASFSQLFKRLGSPPKLETVETNRNEKAESLAVSSGQFPQSPNRGAQQPPQGGSAGASEGGRLNRPSKSHRHLAQVTRDRNMEQRCPHHSQQAC